MPASGWWWACWGCCRPCRWVDPCSAPLWAPLLGASLGELLTAPPSLGPPCLGRLRRSLLVGLAVVAGMLVSRLAQFLLALVVVLGFVLLTAGPFATRLGA